MMLTSPSGGFRIEMLEPKRSLVLMIHDDEEKQGGEISSTFVLNPLDEQQTRLVLRLRARFTGVGGQLFGLLFDFGDFVMMRKMLFGIQQRAEMSANQPLPSR